MELRQKVNSSPITRAFLYSVIAFLILVMFAWSQNKAWRIKSNSYRVKATVTDYSTSSRSGINFYYEFKIGNKVCHGMSVVHIPKTSARKFKGKSLPCLVDANDYSNSVILISTKQYEKYGEVIPDSLSWIRLINNY